jgi:hypothetical protein
MKKVIFINWRWTIIDNEGIRPNQYKEKTIDGNNEKSVIISTFTKTENRIKEFNDLIGNILIDENIDCVVLTHNSGGTVDIGPEKIVKPENFNGGFKVFGFSGGKVKIYYGKTNNPCGMIDEDDAENQLIIENFDLIWDYYWNQLELEYQKKRIINTFLPLILDIKGFDEVTDKKSKEKYHIEIKEAIKEYSTDLITSWNEIKSILALKVDNKSKVEEVLSEKYQLENKTKLYLSPLECESKPGFSLQDITELFADSKEKEREEVIQWFNEIIEAINKKIEPQRESGVSV